MSSGDPRGYRQPWYAGPTAAIAGGRRTGGGLDDLVSCDDAEDSGAAAFQVAAFGVDPDTPGSSGSSVSTLITPLALLDALNAGAFADADFNSAPGDFQEGWSLGKSGLRPIFFGRSKCMIM